MDVRILSDDGYTDGALTAAPEGAAAAAALQTTPAPHGYGYGHYISYYGHYSYILLILMGVTVLLGSLLVAYVKKIDSGIMRRSAERSRCTQTSPLGDGEADDLKKDLPPEYRVALDMPRPDMEDYVRFFEYTVVHSDDSLSRDPQEPDPEPSQAPTEEAEAEAETPQAPDTVLRVESPEAEEPTVREALPSYDDYIQSLSEITQC